MRVERITGVPKNKIAEISKDFMDAGAIKVVVEEDPSETGQYAVIATFRDDD